MNKNDTWLNAAKEHANRDSIHFDNGSFRKLPDGSWTVRIETATAPKDGDTVTVRKANGDTKECKVMGVARCFEDCFLVFVY